jgi:hypothetical protein
LCICILLLLLLLLLLYTNLNICKIDFLNNQKKQKQPQQQVGFYRPIVFPNDFWLIKRDAYPINETTDVLPLTIKLESINLWKFNLYAVLAEEKKQKQTVMPPSSIDEMKRMMMNIDPSYMLSVTLITCLLHGLFELLAFKNGKYKKSVYKYVYYIHH